MTSALLLDAGGIFIFALRARSCSVVLIFLVIISTTIISGTNGFGGLCSNDVLAAYSTRSNSRLLISSAASAASVHVGGFSAAPGFTSRKSKLVRAAVAADNSNTSKNINENDHGSGGTLLLNQGYKASDRNKKNDTPHASTRAAAADPQETSTTNNDDAIIIDYPHVYVPSSFFSSSSSSTASSADLSSLSSSLWIKEAAQNLQIHGMCALLSPDRNGTKHNQEQGQEQGTSTEINHNNTSDSTKSEKIIQTEICTNANKAASSRLNEMHSRIQSRGIDPKGVQDGPYRFMEVICRDEHGGKRYDLPVPWLGGGGGTEIAAAVGSQRIGAPLLPEEEQSIASLHSRLNTFIRPIMNQLWGMEEPTQSPKSSNNNDNVSSQSRMMKTTADAYNVAAAGFLINEVGSENQKWHRDGPDEGYIDVFVPLIDLTQDMGPTAVKPGTHNNNMENSSLTDENINEKTTTFSDASNSSQQATIEEEVTPLLKQGEILLFDYRTIHRGQGNWNKENITRTLAYIVCQRTNRQDVPSSAGDIHNFQSAVTLEYD